VNYISGIESAFKTFIGNESINRLRDSITDKPMILIAGDQLTGKSTQAKNLAEYFGGEFYSVGSLFRQAAKERGITVAEQARLLLVERGIDVEIDYKTCQMISGSNTNSNLGVIEGRQPAYMGSFMANLGKKNIVRLYFQCSILEQALRFLRREIGEEFYQIGRKAIPKKDYETLESLRDEIQLLDINDKQKAIDDFIENQNRDEDDRHRYSELYGFDYGNLDGYDLVIDTNDKEPDVVLDLVIKKLEDFGFRAD
jgi:cytidylate kinase|tara:strand:- start:4422 stop:5186 length:765 start_codon:yes stop_codon:yes gene_type:complete